MERALIKSAIEGAPPTAASTPRCPMPQARAQQHPLQAKLPRVQSMLALQQQVSRGMWAERHLKGLIGGRGQLAPASPGVLECTRETQRFLQRQPKKQQSAQTKCAQYIIYSRFFSQPLTNTHLSSPLFSRNTVCVCAVCPSATSEWLECFKGVVKKQRQGASGVELNACDDLKRRLEICTQHARLKAAAAAVMPSDRNDVVL